MPQIFRCRFVSIGHEGARIDDEILETHIGEDPSHTLVIAENGSGKSSFLALILWAITGGKLPEKSRDIKDYVQMGETAYIIIEWLLDSPEMQTTSARYITGVCLERDDAHSHDKLEKLYFSTRVLPDVPSLTLEQLPLYIPTENGPSLRSLKNFRTQWQYLRRDFPQGEVDYTNVRTVWWERLTDAGIDPALFTYLVHMNAHEANAGSLFEFESAAHFVNYFLTLIADDATPQRIASHLEKHKKRLAKYEYELIPSLQLINDVFDLLPPLEDAAAQRDQLSHDLLVQYQLLVSMEAYLESAHRKHVASANTLNQRYEQAMRDAGLKDRQSRDFIQLAAYFSLHAATKKRQRLFVEKQSLEKCLKESEFEEACWQFAPLLYDAATLAQRIREVERQIELRYEQQRPLLMDLRLSGSRYRFAIEKQIMCLQEAVDRLRSRRKGNLEEAERIRSQRDDARRQEQEQQAHVRSLQEQIVDIQRIRQKLEQKGIVYVGEQVPSAQDRISQEVATLSRTIEATQYETQGLQEQVESMRKDHALVDRAIANLHSQERTLKQELEAMQREAVLIRDDLWLENYLEVEHIAPEQLDSSLVDFLQQKALQLESQISKHQFELQEDEISLAYLREHHLLPPNQSTLSVLEFLQGHNLSPYTGWSYLAETVPMDDTREWIDQHPDVAMGVVLREAEYERAKAALSACGLVLDHPVSVVSTQAFRQPKQERYRLVVGPTNHAHFDKVAGEQACDEKLQQMGKKRETLSRLKDDYQALQKSMARLQFFFHHYPPGWRGQHEQKLSSVRQQIEEKSATSWEMHATLAKTAEQVRKLTGALEDLRKQLREKERQGSQLDPHLEKFKVPVSSLEGQIQAGIVSLQNLQAQIQSCDAQASAVSHDAELLLDEVGMNEREQQRLDFESSMIKHVFSPEEEPFKGEEQLALPVNLQALRDRYLSLQNEYDQKLGKGALQDQLQQLQGELQEKQILLNTRVPHQEMRDVIGKLLERVSQREDIEPYARKAMVAAVEAKEGLKRVALDLDAAAANLYTLQQKWLQIGQGQDGLPEVLVPEEEGTCQERARDAEYQGEKCQREARQDRDEAHEMQVALLKRKHRWQALEHLHAQIKKTLADHSSTFQEIAEQGEDSEACPLFSEEMVEQHFELVDVQLQGIFRRIQTLDQTRDRVSRAIQNALKKTRESYPQATLTFNIEKFSPDDFEQRYGQLWQQLTVHKRTIESDLARAPVSQQMVLQDFMNLANKGTQMLIDLPKRSRIPANVRSLGQRPFFRIRFKELGFEEKQLRLSRLYQQYLQAETVPSGLKLFQEIVHSVLDALSVEVLFTNTYKPYYISIEKMAKKSGGERLTAIVLLFCTLIRFREIERTQHHHASSCLILDNPLGSASRLSFLELQREVAQNMQVQLLYFTSVDIPEASRMFSNLIYLRNDKVDVETGEQLVSMQRSVVQTMHESFLLDPQVAYE